MTQYGYVLLGLTAIIAALVAVLTFAVLKFSAAGAKVLFDKIEELLPVGGEQQFCPYAFNALAHEFPLHAVPVEDLPWIEIDFLEDLRRAREEIWPAIEARRRQSEPAGVSAAVAASNPSPLPCN